jgi:hypothetical protein
MTEHVKRFGEYFIDMNSAPPPFTPDKPFLSAEIQVKGQAR